MLNNLIKKYQLSLRNLLYLIAAIPLATVLKVNIWVLEVADFSIAAIILIWFFRSYKPGAERKLFKYTVSVIKPWFAFFLWSFTTLMFAYNHVGGDGFFAMVLRIIKLIAYMFIFWIMLSEGIRRKRSYRYIIFGFLFGLALNSVFVAKGIEANGNIKNLATESDQIQQESRPHERKGGLTFYNATGSVIACYLIAFIPLFLRKRSPLLGILIALLSFEMLMGQSRGAWATFLFGLLLLSRNNRFRIVGIIVLLAIIGFAGNSSLIRDRITTPQEGLYDGGRFEIAQKYIIQIIDNPIIGKGLYGRFYRPDMNSTGSHNQYIQVLLETGIIGLILYLFALMRLGKFLKRAADPFSNRLIGIVFATQLFSVLSGEFWYGGSIICAQLMLSAFMFIEGNRKELLEVTAVYLREPVSRGQQLLYDRAKTT